MKLRAKKSDSHLVSLERIVPCLYEQRLHIEHVRAKGSVKSQA